MKPYIGVGLSVGILAGIWTQVSIELGLITWVAFIAWACFFAAGGGAHGFRNGLAANLSGVVYGWLVALLTTVADFPGVLAVGVGVAALAMCLQAGWAPLSFIPGAFAGTAAFFGTALSFWPTVAALVIGAGLGWASALIGDRLQRLLIKPEAAAGARDPNHPVQTA
ncbi:DUF1097 domain-containing protein [Pseudarthrobacter oxydans]|jgi:hypothetical protein|uniref:DUF1097 domain-containing protein n=1 Tax=Arthrobacter liuii TaxID=1476996 RepID=A0ABQ2AWC6_9MICC|nr:MULTISPECIES: DUF1097 domain-containing protein [Micrococcaceae]MBA4102858.1 DUF1097 domain-containing protein [Arthrobacter sp.]MDV2982617.1 DUF1097 domain-containing protein [Actinomycetes bacterium ARC8]NSX38915.1 DUF1097 domain-containing protein [Pseudarthrobacter oxydans]BFE43448.1 DUF1097 domain-containing protein [Pseudarthrobacter oxydans]GGH99985.1 hypothetical protein GCM10007170_36090 [Arthrobacter liuii]